MQIEDSNDSYNEETPNLIRSRNYFDLNERARDEQRQKWTLSIKNEEDEEEEEKTEIERRDTQTQVPSLEAYADIETQTIDQLDHDIYELDHNNNMANSQETEEERQDCNKFIATEVYEETNNESRLDILRDLLSIERQKNEQRRDNNRAMQQYVKKLQNDYLQLQGDLLETLELCHKVKAQKEAQIESLNSTVNEKSQYIEQLKEKLQSLNVSRLREEFKEQMAKQNELAEVERQQLRDQIDTFEQQLVRERINSSQLLQQFQTKLDDQLKSNKLEIEQWSSKANHLELELERILSEPKNLVIKSLREEKSKLDCQLDELNLLVDDNRLKFDSLRKRLESLLSEQEIIEKRNFEEVQLLHEQQAQLKRHLGDTKLELDDKEEMMQILQFNLNRSEKRVKNLISTLKGKEAAYNELIGQLQVKQEQIIEKSSNSLKALERKVLDHASEVDRKQNEIVRLQMEHENQLDSIRNDRDQRVINLEQEKIKAERALQVCEIKLARELDDKEMRIKQVEQLQKEVLQFREESKRLSIELTKSEAKLYSKQQDLNQLVKERELREEEISERQLIDLDLEETRRQTRRLEETIDELRNDNEKLHMMLKLNESHMATLNASIKKEHSKMIHEYEKKMEQIRIEQSVYDRNKIRYKKYGYKLKKYCDHLRRVHEHLCSPTICGYTITQ